MTNAVGSCPLCAEDGGRVLWRDECLRVVLTSEAQHPLLLRVILEAHLAEMTDLEVPVRERLMQVVFAAESALRATVQPDKINLASLGNLVPHLHWHVIPRWKNDSCFPRSIWSEALRPNAHAVCVEASFDVLQKHLQQFLAH